MREDRINFTAEQTCDEMKCPILIPFLREAMQLKYDEEPNYNRFRFLLEINIMNLDRVPNKKLFWTIRNQPLNQELE